MKIYIYGAGSIGCYLGGRLVAAGNDVTFITRPRIHAELSQFGLVLTDYLGKKIKLAPHQLKLTTDPAQVVDADVIFICVKSAATEQVAHELKEYLGTKTPLIISFQNGLSNVPILKRVLQEQMILEGMVPFNVATQEAGHYHQGTSGALSVKQYPNQNLLENAFQKAGLEIVFEKDMLAVQWAKLLLNLNNSINALSKKPLKEQLSIRKYRQCVAMAQQEAIELLDYAQIKPAKLTAVPTHLIPKLLSLPNPLFKLLSRKMLAIDPLARSSMQDDLIAGRPTEVDWINGEVLKLAEQCGRQAPINARLIELIKQAEKSSLSFSMSADTLKDQLKSAAKQ